MENSNDVDVCQQANRAALEKGLTFCETPESRIRTLAEFVGFDGDEIDPDEILGLDTDDETVDVRKRVLAEAESQIDDGESQPLSAMHAAWDSVTGGDSLGVTEPEPEPETDDGDDGDTESESELDEELDVDLDDEELDVDLDDEQSEPEPETAD